MPNSLPLRINSALRKVRSGIRRSLLYVSDESLNKIFASTWMDPRKR